MNKFAQVLIDKASELRGSTPELVAIGLLKEAGMQEEEARLTVAQDVMEKQAFSDLTYRGVDAEEAAKLVKAAKINVRDLPGMAQETEEEMIASVLEKAAAYIEKQAAYIEALESQPVHETVVEKVVEVEVEKATMSDSMTKLASVGAFTYEDLAALESVPEEVLTKVASAMEEPWDLGRAAGISRPKTDPLLEFILG